MTSTSCYPMMSRCFNMRMFKVFNWNWKCDHNYGDITYRKCYQNRFFYTNRRADVKIQTSINNEQSSEGPTTLSTTQHERAEPLKKFRKIKKFGLVDIITLAFMFSLCAIPIAFLFNSCYYDWDVIEAEFAAEEEAKNKSLMITAVDENNKIENEESESQKVGQQTSWQKKPVVIKQKKPRLER